MSHEIETWRTFCGKIPKEEVIYFCQIFAIYIVLISCVINLSIGSGEKDTLWAGLLSGCLGYILPAPKIHDKDESFLHNTPQ